jgi:cyanophycinase-like exopeptidase
MCIKPHAEARMAAQQKAVYLIAGGRSSVVQRGPDPLLKEALQMAARVRPSIAYIGAASRDNSMFRAMITRQLHKAGAGEVRLAPLCGRHADPGKATRIIESADLVFMSGGDVEAGMKTLERSGIIPFLREQSSGGKAFAGLSAGSIMLAKSWVRWANPEDMESAEIFPCMGIAQVCCDTHDESDDWEELQTLTRLLADGTISYGIPSGTALAAYSNGSVRAIGGEVHCFARKGLNVVRIKNLKPQV